MGCYGIILNGLRDYSKFYFIASAVERQRVQNALGVPTQSVRQFLKFLLYAIVTYALHHPILNTIF